MEDGGADHFAKTVQYLKVVLHAYTCIFLNMDADTEILFLLTDADLDLNILVECLLTQIRKFLFSVCVSMQVWNPNILVECLVSDFAGMLSSVDNCEYVCVYVCMCVCIYICL
jgi:lipoate synthase